jgi:hypothetical protein
MCASISRSRAGRSTGSSKKNRTCGNLPLQPYDTGHVFYRAVNSEGEVLYRQNSYSAPFAADWRTAAGRRPGRWRLGVHLGAALVWLQRLFQRLSLPPGWGIRSIPITIPL